MSLEDISRGSWERHEKVVLTEIKRLTDQADNLEKIVVETGQKLSVISDRLGENGIIALQIESLGRTIQGNIDVIKQEFSSKIGSLANQIEEIKRRELRAIFARYEEMDKRIGLINSRVAVVERRTDFIKAWVMGGAAVLYGLWWLWKEIVQPYLTSHT